VPTLIDILEATPRCRARRMIRRGQHGVHFTCYEPMRYLSNIGEWWCLACGAYTPAAMAVARLRALEVMLRQQAA
jgi:hypothetical protein